MDQKDLDAIASSAAAGVRMAIADPRTWDAGFAAMGESLRNSAQKESGRWIVGWFGWLMRKAALGFAIIAVLYYTGGWSAVVTWLKFGGTK